jgi:hypothetical protein
LTLTEDKGGLEVYLVGAAVNSAGARWQAVDEPAWHPAGPASLNFFYFFPMISVALTLKISNMTFLMSKIYQTFQDDSFKHKEQLYFLDQLQNPTLLQVINFGTNSNLNLT